MDQVNESLLQSFYDDLVLRNITTAYGYHRVLARYLLFLEQIGQQPLSINKEILKKYLIYLRSKNLKSGSLEKMFNVLSAFYDFLEAENKIETNIVPSFRKRYLRQYKVDPPAKRKFLSIEELALLVRSTIHTRDRAIILLLFKTGIRCHELTSLDVSDVDLPNMTITLKPTPKRSNRTVFFDYETSEALSRWLGSRNLKLGHNSSALWLNDQGDRLSPKSVYNALQRHAIHCGLQNSDSKKLEDRIGPHCGRVWFSAWLERSGMKREDIQELRGDAHREAIDIYLRKDMAKLREAYLSFIPQLGI
jgi:integrase/recombinase XerD